MSEVQCDQQSESKVALFLLELMLGERGTNESANKIAEDR